MQLRTVDVESGNLADLVDGLQRAETAVTIVEDGKPVALLIRPADYDGLVETLEIMADAELVADIEQARADYAAGRALDGLEAARALRTGA
ncbi:type II toxin-antitoxin system Phd/YefM family antitoxin [Candidatus Poriferisodalis sp.]|uniref:type II toxin-antitoxin system Phd/YefM family antitoxin n=1 Tax=Candidatus Poriferisodalis sp. TaxID=3101277 RepID=UPI003B010E83